MRASIFCLWFTVLVFASAHCWGADCTAADARYFQTSETGIAETLANLAEVFTYQLVTDPQAVAEQAVFAGEGCASLAQWLVRLLPPLELEYQLVGDTLVVFPRIVAAPVASDSSVATDMNTWDYSEVVVTGSPQRQSTTSIFAGITGDSEFTIDQQQLKQLGITSLGSALELVSGVKVEDNRFMVIRGMTGRYQAVRINGGVIPSLDPSGQGFPLDVFPVNILNAVDLRKSVLADAPGSATGGMINIETMRIPDEPFFQMLAGVGGIEGTSFETVFQGYRNNSDWQGQDDGTRALPSLLHKAARQGGLDTLNEAERELAGEQAVVADMGIYHGRADANLLSGLSAGRSWESGDYQWGGSLSLGYSNDWQRQLLQSRLFNRVGSNDGEWWLRANQLASNDRVVNTVDSNGLFTSGVSFGEHYLGLNLLLLRQSRHYTEWIDTHWLDEQNESIGPLTKRGLFNWSERQLQQQQIYGLSQFSSQLKLNWQFSHAVSKYRQPFDVSYRYTSRAMYAPYQLGFGFDQLQLHWRRMREHTSSGSMQLDYQWLPRVDFKAGLERYEADRSGYDLPYSFSAEGGAGEVRGITELANPTWILSDANIVGGPDKPGFLLVDDLAPEDNSAALAGRFYRVNQRHLGSYLLVETRLLDHWHLVAGMRWETRVIQGEMWNTAPATSLTLLDGNKGLPSFALGYAPRQTQQWLLGYSRTVVWPAVNELMPMRYEELDTRVSVVGNPLLEVANADNWDVRWRYDKGAGVQLDMAVFYKSIGNAIEGVFFDPQDEKHPYNNYTFRNMAEAKVWGAELEADHMLQLPKGQELVTQLRVAKVYSHVHVKQKAEYAGKRVLQGQPDIIAALQLQYRFDQNTWSLFFKRVGRELFITSDTPGLPEVYREPHSDLRLAYSRALSTDISVTFTLENLLDDEDRYDQGGQPFLQFSSGRELTLLFAADF
ncbi:TonB-dependent receptor domain-containing protein [Teredinibacter haidensis]|uniref:TonB-dependent receptor domain-containing protein n=1 Tax=Teredinibacter haidensis TaxID=2731755 RepID=UPI0009488ACA|nr:TonB-dependent receptor [Teredinibacter haidensis]